MFGIVKRGISFFTAGAWDRITFQITGKKNDFAKCIAARINDCLPCEDRYEKRIVADIWKALRDKNYQSARSLEAIGAKEGADRYCTSMMRRVIDFVAENHELDFERTEFFISE